MSRSPDRLLDQAVLRRAEQLGPIGLQREGIETEFRDRAPPPCRASRRCEMLRLAAGDRGRDRRLGDAAVDPKAGQRQPPRAEMPLLRAARPAWGSAVRAPGLRLPDGSPAPRAGAPRAAAARSARRSAAPPCGPASGRAHRRHLRRPGTAAPAPAAACRISAPMVLRPSRSSVRTVSGSSRRAETWRQALKLVCQREAGIEAMDSPERLELASAWTPAFAGVTRGG